MNNKFLFLLTLFIFIVASAFFYWPRFAEMQIASDSLEYHQLAINLLSGKGFYLEDRGGVTMFREPLYPVFLFVNYKIFGMYPNLIRLEQLILVFLMCFLVYKISRDFFSENVSRLAATMVALHPLFIIYSGEIISETLTAFLILLFCFTLIWSLKYENLFYSLLSGLILGLLALTKSIFVFMPIFIIIYYFFWGKNKKILQTLLFVIGFCLLVLPWSYRNYLLFDRWAIAERGGVAAYVHTSKTELSGQDLKNYAISALFSQYFVRLRDNSFDIFKINIDPMNKKIKAFLGEGYSRRETDILLLNEAKKSWKEYPFKNFLIGFLELSKANAPTVPRNSVIFVYDISGGLWQQFIKGWVIIFVRLLWLSLTLISFYGIFKVAQERIYLLFPLILFIVYLNGLIFFLEGTPRFIFPIYSLYFIFFIYGVQCIKKAKIKN